MTKLYPIGTQLITRRLSQSALYFEIFGKIGIWSYWKDGEKEPGFNFTADWWKVQIYPLNQTHLNPVPMVGDLVTFTEKERCFAGEVVQVQESTVTLVVPEKINGKDYYIIHKNLSVVEKRTYPNGQRGPMLEWDEVIEPKYEIQP